MSKLSRAVKRRDISADMLKKIEQNIESVPFTFHDKMSKILADIPIDKLHKDLEFETVAIIARSATLAGIWSGELKTVAQHQQMQGNVDDHFRNRWKIVKENPSANIDAYLNLMTVVKLCFV